MRNIVIVGAGQSGLLAALGLQRAGHKVTVVSDRSAEAIRTGRVMSGQVLFESALGRERKLGLHYWDDDATPLLGMRFSMDESKSDGHPFITWRAQFKHPANSVDQRLKMSRWLDEFVNCGGELHIRRADLDDLEEYAASNDLVLVAAGRGDQFSTLFQRDTENSPYEEPQRAIALIYVSSTSDLVLPQASFNIQPGIGEFYWIPTLSVHGPVQGLCLSGIPGGPLDCWQGVNDIDEQWETFQTLIRKYFPWEAETFTSAHPAGPMDSLTGRVTPVVRKAVGTLPSGRHLLAMGDTAITNDPIGGQGANNAVHCAVSYLDSIADHGSGHFDREFMERCYSRYWDHARHATQLSNDLLAPPPDHVIETLTAAQFNPEVAKRFASMFDNPIDYGRWLANPDTARRYLQSL